MDDNGHAFDKTCGRLSLESLDVGPFTWSRRAVLRKHNAIGFDSLDDLTVSDLHDLKYLIDALLRETGQ